MDYKLARELLDVAEKNNGIVPIIALVECDNHRLTAIPFYVVIAKAIAALGDPSALGIDKLKFFVLMTEEHTNDGQTQEARGQFAALYRDFLLCFNALGNGFFKDSDMTHNYETVRAVFNEVVTLMIARIDGMDEIVKQYNLQNKEIKRIV